MLGESENMESLSRLIGRPIKRNVKRKYSSVGERPELFSAFSPDDLFPVGSNVSRRATERGSIVPGAWVSHAISSRFCDNEQAAQVSNGNHGPIGGSWPSAFLGYPRGQRVSPETSRFSAQPNGRLVTLPRTRSSPEPCASGSDELPGVCNALRR